MIGPGKYDDLLTQAREAVKARGGLLILFGGDRGPGFSAQLPLDLLVSVPKILRDVADQIEADRKKWHP